MATLKTLYHTSFYCAPVSPSVSVFLCLDESWKDKTVSGRNWAQATLKCKTTGNSCQWNYILEVDRDQFLVDGVTGEVYDIVDDDILQIFPYVCTLSQLLADTKLSHIDTITGTGTVEPDLDNAYTPLVVLAPSAAADVNIDTAINGIVGSLVTFWLANTTGAVVNFTFTGSYVANEGQGLKISLDSGDFATFQGVVLAGGIIDFIGQLPVNAGLFENKITPTGTYTTLQSDFGRHISVDNNVTLLDPSASDVGRQVRIFNTSGGNITISSAAGLIGNATVATLTARTAYVTAANEYQLF